MSKYADYITPRAIKFNTQYHHAEQFWHSHQPAPTYTFNALAIYLPILERLVVMSLKQSIDKQAEPSLPAPLKQEVQSLIAQEAYHGSEFAKMIPHMILKHYPKVQTKYKFRLFRGFAYILNKINPHFHYALSAAGEHFTAISADLFLRKPEYFAAVNPAYSAIWRWHAIEEIEHKNVAFDVFQHFKGGYFSRVIAMILMTGVFATFMLKPIWQMMREDKNHRKLSCYKALLSYHWGKQGLWRALLKDYFYYYHPKFHPNKIQNAELIHHWRIALKNHTDNQSRLKLLEEQQSAP